VNSFTESMGHFRYPRHFSLLTCFCGLIAVMSRLKLTGSLPVGFATYGALHASALAFAVRTRQPSRRLFLFIVSAGALSAATLEVALLGRPLFYAVPHNMASYSLLGSSAAIGAISYGILIRSFGFLALSVRALAAISFGCAAAAFIALFTASHGRFFGPWWIAAWWWYGFSGGLWYFDRRYSAGGSTTGR